MQSKQSIRTKKLQTVEKLIKPALKNKNLFKNETPKLFFVYLSRNSYKKQFPVPGFQV